MIIKAKVKPNSSLEKIEKVSEGEYNIWLKERANKGKAIRIKNFASRKKIVEINLENK